MTASIWTVDQANYEYGRVEWLFWTVRYPRLASQRQPARLVSRFLFDPLTQVDEIEPDPFGLIYEGFARLNDLRGKPVD